MTMEISEGLMAGQKINYNSVDESYSSVDLNFWNECLIPYCTIKQPKKQQL